VQLCSDDVRDAAYSVRLAQDARRKAQLGLLLALLPTSCGTVAATLGLLPPHALPALTLCGTLAGLARAR
jgi:cation transport ATPase